MSLAFDGKPVIEKPFMAKIVEKGHPGCFTLPTILEGICVSYYDERIAGPGQQDVKPLRSC
jgi:hypothetical protein